MSVVSIVGLRCQCERCGKSWDSHRTKAKDIVVCPSCKSPYWNKPKVK